MWVGLLLPSKLRPFLLDTELKTIIRCCGGEVHLQLWGTFENISVSLFQQGRLSWYSWVSFHVCEHRGSSQDVANKEDVCWGLGLLNWLWEELTSCSKLRESQWALRRVTVL